MPTSKKSPIGIFDSGVGGISVTKSIRALMPNESIIYVADSLHAPYGDKSNAFIEDRALLIAHYLVERGVKAILVACNTATVVAIDSLRVEFDIPIIGMEPGVKPAVLTTKTGVVGLLATSRTLGSPRLKQLVASHASGVRFELQACPGLVEQVEAMEFQSETTTKLLVKYIYPLLEKGADTLVLGCTHYVFLHHAIQNLVGDSINLISTNQAVARQLRHRLLAGDLLSSIVKGGLIDFQSSRNSPEFDNRVSQLWGESVRAGVLESELSTARCRAS